ncbi:MAG: DUF2147 domain-containing protein [Flavobacteriales bacterium]|nr:DUF2147 domain-containing protein [Flavobacteriales bacterium]
MRALIILSLALTPLTAPTDPTPSAVEAVTGRWTSIDDNTHEPRSIVEITWQDGTLHGRILKLYRDPGEDPDPICTKCTDDRKDRKVVGMTIFDDLRYDDGTWEGTILDPESGKVYTCKIWPENDHLMVRGYLLFFYRTQEWIRG